MVYDFIEPDEEPKYMVVTTYCNPYKVKKQVNKWSSADNYALEEGDIGEVVDNTSDKEKTVMRFKWYDDDVYILVKNEFMREATPDEVAVLKLRVPFNSFKITKSGGKKRSSRTRTTRKTRHQNIQVRRAGRRTNKHRRDRRRNAKK